MDHAARGRRGLFVPLASQRCCCRCSVRGGARCARRQAPARARLLERADRGHRRLQRAGAARPRRGRGPLAERGATGAPATASRRRSRCAGSALAGSGCSRCCSSRSLRCTARAQRSAARGARVPALAAYESVTHCPPRGRSLRTCPTAAGRPMTSAAATPRVRTSRGPGSRARESVAMNGLRYATRRRAAGARRRRTRVAAASGSPCRASGAGKTSLANCWCASAIPTRAREHRRHRLRELDRARSAGGAAVRTGLATCSTPRSARTSCSRPRAGERRYGARSRRSSSRTGPPACHRASTPCGSEGELALGRAAPRLALARALLSRARFLIVDEPTAHLEPQLARRVMAKLAGLATIAPCS